MHPPPLQPFNGDNELEPKSAFPLFKGFIHRRSRGDSPALAQCRATEFGAARTLRRGGKRPHVAGRTDRRAAAPSTLRSSSNKRKRDREILNLQVFHTKIICSISQAITSTKNKKMYLYCSISCTMPICAPEMPISAKRKQDLVA